MSVLINASTSTGLVQSADTSGEIELQSNGTTALKVNTNEGIQILNCLGVGNATPSTSGAGITFPATQSASSDANTLDDYEEGTWTPVIDSATAGTGRTTTVTSAKYTKIGNLVQVQCYIQITTLGTGGSGAWLVKGLPFTPAASSAFNTFCSGFWNNLNSNLVCLGGYVDSGYAQLLMCGIATAGTSMAELTFSTYVKANTQLMITAIYQV
jgi:hypothetical protein